VVFVRRDGYGPHRFSHYMDRVKVQQMRVLKGITPAMINELARTRAFEGGIVVTTPLICGTRKLICGTRKLICGTRKLICGTRKLICGTRKLSHKERRRI
jgi:hypothetical protein